MRIINKKGFTMMEVLTVIIVITAVIMITIPLISSINKKNKEELYHSYERMMEEYAIASNIKNKDKILLEDLDGLDTIKEEKCKGFVDATTKPYKAYIRCNDYKTTNYDLNKPAGYDEIS